jgi:hypothetical protein
MAASTAKACLSSDSDFVYSRNRAMCHYLALTTTASKELSNESSAFLLWCVSGERQDREKRINETALE